MIKTIGILVILLGLFLLSNGEKPNYLNSYNIKALKQGSKCTIIKSEEAQQREITESKPFVITETPTILDGELNEGMIFSVFAQTKPLAYKILNSTCSEIAEEPRKINLDDEVIPVRVSGPPENRIDLVFMGDGYMQSQRELMLSDMTRLIDDMFTGSTFQNYLPLFNVWVVFRPSDETGIGTGGTPKNTAFGLYRQGTELRAVYCSKQSAARDACSKTGPSGCDFPVLIGNSEYYGGLGGEFAISTSSVSSGTVVLRHELGHNFGSVGEEYDGGSAYYGANFASTLTQVSQKWSDWLTVNPVRAEQSVLRLQAYPWVDLANGDVTYTFTSNGAYGRWFMRFTASGCAEPGSLIVLLDGEELVLEAPGIEDRTFYSFYNPQGFSAGQHTLVFRQGFPPSLSMARQLCSLTLHEYEPEPGFHFSNDETSSYPVWRIGNTFAGYRPTNEECLMRNMTSPNFCDVCYENMWLQFFKTVSAIENIALSCDASEILFSLETLGIGQFRQPPIPGEILTAQWFKEGVHQPSLDDNFSFSLNPLEAEGDWTARVSFKSDEIRYDPENLSTFTKTINVPGDCQ